MFLQCCETPVSHKFHMAKGNFHADTQEHVKNPLPEADARGYLYEWEYGLKHVEEEEEEEAAAAAAEMPVQPVGKDEEPEPA